MHGSKPKDSEKRNENILNGEDSMVIRPYRDKRVLLYNSSKIALLALISLSECVCLFPNSAETAIPSELKF